MRGSELVTTDKLTVIATIIFQKKTHLVSRLQFSFLTTSELLFMLLLLDVTFSA
jgi:hypothetical protein